MENPVRKIREKIVELQDELEKGILPKQREFKYRLEQQKVVFEQGVLARHRLLKMKIGKFLRTSKIGAILTAPVIYSLIIPFALTDLFITVYQSICFPVYRIPKVKRGDHVVMDRKYLAYLNWIEKMNCIYCEYVNGVIAYTREIASRTEQFWCPIKHARKVKDPHIRYYDFIDYGDTENYRAKLDDQREKCRACEMPCGDKTDS